MDKYFIRLLSYKYSVLKSELLKLKARKIDLDKKIKSVEKAMKEKYER